MGEQNCLSVFEERFALESNIPIEDVRSSLKYIDTPSDMKGIYFVTKELRGLDGLLLQVVRKEDRHKVELFNSVIKGMCSCSDELFEGIRTGKGEVIGPRWLGKCCSNPVYAMFFYDQAFNDYRKHHALLKVVVLTIWNKLFDKSDLSTLATVCRSVRELGVGDAELLAKFPEKTSGVKEYETQLTEIFDELNKKRYAEDIFNGGLKFLAEIIDGFHLVRGLRVFKTRNGKKGKEGGGNGFGGIYGIPPEEYHISNVLESVHYDNDLDLTTIELSDESIKKQQQDKEKLDHSSRFKSHILIYKTDSPYEEVIRKRNQNLAVARANQSLYSDKNIPKIQFISLLIQHCLAGLRDVDYTELETDAVSSFLIMCCIFLGKKLDDLVGIRITNNYKGNNRSDIIYDAKKRAFHIRVRILDKKVNVLEGQEKFSISTVDVVSIPALNVVDEFLQNIFHNKKDRKSVFFAEQNISDAKIYLKKYCSKHARSYSDIWIAKFLLYEISNTDSDITIPIHLTGNKSVPHASELYYSLNGSNKLNAIYDSTVDNIISMINSELGYQTGLSIVGVLEKTESYMGCKLVPTQEVVSRMVSSLKGKLRGLRLSGLDGLIEFHNTYTIYCILLLDFCTGIRAIIDKYHDYLCINFSDNFILLSDKDRLDFYNTRPMPLTKIAITQIKYYYEHRFALQRCLACYLDTQEMNSIYQQNFTDKVKRSDIKKYQKEKAGFLFFMRKSGNGIQIIKSTPSDICDFIKDDYDLPDNKNRAYLRRRLGEKGVPGEMLSYFLGHGLYGQKMLDKFSSINLKEYFNVITTALETITHEDGWVAYRGLK